MRRITYYLLFSIIVLTTTSFQSKNSLIKIGESFPFKENLLELAQNNISSSDSEKQYLINFWSSYDAKTRSENVYLNRILSKKFPNVRLLSISNDSVIDLFNKTVEMDNLNKNTQLLASSILPESFRFSKNAGSNLFCILDANGIVKGIYSDLTECLNHLSKK